MSIASEITRLSSAKAALKDAIVAKGVEVADSLKLDGYAEKVASIPTGGGEEAPFNDINFYLPDGFRIYSYTLAEVKAVGWTMPEQPQSWNGLVAQGWTNDLADVIETEEFLDVGGIYGTEDGSTRIEIENLNPSIPQELLFDQDSANDVVVDWGDGETDTFSELSVTATHTYQSKGNYYISLKPTVGKVSLRRYCVGNFYNDSYTATASGARLRSFVFGRNCVLMQYAFGYYANLRYIALPDWFVTFGGNNTFAYCLSLKCLIFPRNVNHTNGFSFDNCSGVTFVAFGKGCNLGSLMLQKCWSIRQANWKYNKFSNNNANSHFYNTGLQRIILADGATQLSGVCLYGCCSLEKIVVPSGVKQVRDRCLMNCINLKLIDFRKVSSVPSMSMVRDIDLHAEGKIVVPDSLYDEWIAATNWSDAKFAGKIIKASEYEGV